MNSSPVIRAQGVCKHFRSGLWRPRRIQALQQVDLSIFEGELFGILGPNGAGKTTFLNILIGLLAADSGSVSVLGQDVSRSYGLGIKRHLNMCSGNPNFPWCLSVQETLNFYGMLYGLGRSVRHRKIDELLEMLELQENRNTRYDELSTGNKQRLSLAKALINDPEILLLDEPTIGLDPDISIKIRKQIQVIHASRGKTILLTTHYMREAEELCGRIAFLKAGHIMALGTPAELQAQTHTQDMEEVFLALAHQ